MKRMRFLVATLIFWLFLFYNIERLSRPINITNVAYTFVPLAAVLIILVPRLHKAPLWALLLVSIPVFLVIKAWLKSHLWGTSLPLTVTEVCFIAVTTIIAHWVSNGVREFEDAIARISIGQADRLPETFSTGQAEMYKEVRRARHHRRPLALMAIRIEDESIQVALDRMVQEVQQAMMRQYVLSDVAKGLCGELEEYNVIARSNDHFLALLPEVTSEELPDLVDRLRQAISERLGVALQVGTACFPEEALTFESLVDKATGEMNGKRRSVRSVRSQQLSLEHRSFVAVAEETANGISDHQSA
jgi:GGDEF domain-containing protein